MSEYCVMLIKYSSEERVLVADLLKYFDPKWIDDLVARYQSDKYVTKLSTQAMFKLIMYSLLDSERISLRTMADNFSTPDFQALEQTVMGQTTAHSSIQSRLCTMEVGFFQKMYDYVSTRLLDNYGKDATSKPHHIKRFDSTMIATFSHLLQGMKVGNTAKKKNQVKLTTEFTDEFGIRMSFSKSQADLGEEVALKRMILSATHSEKDIVVFDRGIKSRDTFCEFDDLGLRYITRLHDRNRHKIIRNHADVPIEVVGKLKYLSDNIVHLYSEGIKEVIHEFRLIETVNVDSDKKVWFLTNILFLSATEIAELYKSRWDIEVLFRFMKQEMNLNHFVCNNQNAIQIMLYMTLIVSMLILIYKKLNKISSYKRAKTAFIKELEATVLLEILEGDPETIQRLKACLRERIRKRHSNSK